MDSLEGGSGRGDWNMLEVRVGRGPLWLSTVGVVVLFVVVDDVVAVVLEVDVMVALLSKGADTLCEAEEEENEEEEDGRLCEKALPRRELPSSIHVRGRDGDAVVKAATRLC